MHDFPRIEVDFNDLDDDGRLGALTSSADDASALEPGALVTLWDEDGNTAQGRVAELADRGQVWIDLLRATWRSGAEATAGQATASDLAALTPPVGLLAIGSAAGLVTPFGAAATPVLHFGPMLVYLTSMHRFGPSTVLSWAARPDHLDFAESYKLRSVAGTAPVTAELGP